VNGFKPEGSGHISGVKSRTAKARESEEQPRGRGRVLPSRKRRRQIPREESILSPAGKGDLSPPPVAADE